MNDNPKRKRIIKDLPPSLLDILKVDSFDGNLFSFVKFRLENNPNPKEEQHECMVAYEVTAADGTIMGLENDLNLDQLRAFSRKAGCNYVSNKNKFACRRALYIQAMFNEKMKREGIVVATADEKMTNNIIRITNIVFSHEFVDSFLTLNDIKKREDHESGNIPKKFWAELR